MGTTVISPPPSSQSSASALLPFAGQCSACPTCGFEFNPLDPFRRRVIFVGHGGCFLSISCLYCVGKYFILTCLVHPVFEGLWKGFTSPYNLVITAEQYDQSLGPLAKVISGMIQKRLPTLQISTGCLKGILFIQDFLNFRRPQWYCPNVKSYLCVNK